MCAVLFAGHSPAVMADSGLFAMCALPYAKGKPGNDCTGKHSVQYSVTGADENTQVDVELMSLDADGELIEIRDVTAGDEVQMASRIDAVDYKFSTVSNNKGDRHQVFAPIPLLRVTAQNATDKVQAFCSNVPFVQVVEPNGNVVTASSGDVTDVMLAIPGVDVGTMQLLVDGIDILSELGINPATDLPGGPFNGTVNIGEQPVEVENLLISSAGIEMPAANMVSMKLRNLGGGGHIVYVESSAQAGILADNSTDTCHIDDLADAGTVSVFEVELTSPQPGEITDQVPTPVTGVVRHGRPIGSLNINSQAIDVSGQVFTPGDGKTSADNYVLDFGTIMYESNLSQDIATGDAALDSFDPGSNRVVADAADDRGNHAYDNHIFATGSVGKPEAPAGNAELGYALQASLEDYAGGIAMAAAEEVQSESQLDNAIVVGLTPEAMAAKFEPKCQEAALKFKESVTESILATAAVKKKISGGCSCSPNVTFSITGVSVDETQYSCPIEMKHGEMRVTMNLPNVVVTATGKGKCKVEEADVCIAKTEVDISATTTISQLQFAFDVTEGQFLGEPITPPDFVTGVSTVHTTGGAKVSCLATVCDWAVDNLVNIFTFGTVDMDLTPKLDMTNVTDFTQAIDSSEPDPVELEEIKVDEEKVEEFGQASLSGGLSSVTITPQGLLATLTGNFRTLEVDPDVEQTPGVALTPAPAPVMNIAGGKQATVLLADDVLNMLYGSMSESGGLKTSCQDTGKYVGDMFPADCDSLSAATPEATAASQGSCHGIREASCDGLFGVDATTTVVKRGYCHAAQAANCSLLADGPVRSVCEQAPRLNITATDTVLTCTQQAIPPRLLIKDDPSTEPVETAVRLNDMSVAMVVDVDGDGMANDIAAPECLSGDAASNQDCVLHQMCLDLNLVSEMSLVSDTGGVCEAGVSGLLTTIQQIQLLNRQEGVICSGALNNDAGGLAGTAAGDATVSEISGNIDVYTPPMCMNGLTVGGFVSFNNPKLISVETDGDSEFQDYLGITGDMQ